MERNTKKIFFFWLFVFLGIFLPGQIVWAAWYDFLIGAVTFIPMVTIALVLVVAVALANLLAAFSGLILNWVLSPDFINWSYTNPATNPIVAIGLNITQPFVNMILILVLVFIALATILRLAGYEIQKLLPTFIIVALLVNFAPVLCGLIVDATNIVMNFFIKEITGGKQLISMFKALGDVLVGGISWQTFKATKQIEIVLQLVVLIVVNLSLFLILLLFALLFMIRYMAIWLLVILSPLAFACYILPVTKKIFNLWWEHFIQWSIIGVTMGFFLYLADQFATLNPTLPPAEGLGGAILPPLFPLLFLYLGFLFGLQTSAIGTSTIIAGFRAAHKRAQVRTLGAIGRTITGPARTYKELRAGGATRLQALTGTPKVYWHKAKGAAKTLVTPSAWGPALRAKWATGKGILGIIKDVAGVGIEPIREAWGIPKKKKERPTCPRCGNYVPVRAKFCPHCQYQMPTCSGPRRHVMDPGVPFCHSCGYPPL